MKVVIIGTGNVATVLGKKISAAGNTILQVAGRNFEKTNVLAAQLGCEPIYNVRYITLTADIYIVAVPDSSVTAVAEKLKLSDKIAVHTAAAVSKSALSGCSGNFGVLYPLQTLIKQVSALPPIPVLIDANNYSTEEWLLHFSSHWADYVQVANDEERLKVHVAAVFLNNFTSHIFTLLKEYCKKEQLKMSLLYPLIEETITRIKSNDFFTIQTGPAIRHDYSTLEKHTQILSYYPELQKVYKLFTDSITDFYHKSKE